MVDVDALLGDLAHVRRGYVNAAMGYRHKGDDVRANTLEVAVLRLDEAVRKHVPGWPQRVRSEP